MKRLILTTWAAICGMSLWAGSSQTLIPFNGRLTNNKGIPYSEGRYTLTFNLYDTVVGGTASWTERHEKIGVVNGMVNVFLGSIASLDAIDFSRAWYLGVTISAEGNTVTYNPEMVPRQRVVPAFYAKDTMAVQGCDWSSILEGSSVTNMNRRLVKVAKISDESITTVKIKNGTLLTEDLSEEARSAVVPIGTVQPYAGTEVSVPKGWEYVGPNSNVGLTTANTKKTGFIIKVEEPVEEEEDDDDDVGVDCIPRQELDHAGGVQSSARSGYVGDVVFTVDGKGSIFGADPGEGRCLTKCHLLMGDTEQIKEWPYSMELFPFQTKYEYEFSDCGKGIYRVQFTKVPKFTSEYKLFLTYDGLEHYIAIPPDDQLSDTEWFSGPNIVVNSSLEKITAVFAKLYEGCCIPAVRVVKMSQDQE